MSDPADGQEAATAWEVVLYHYQPDKARALREAVLPLARQAAADGLAAHVERHWRYGPHLRLRLRGPEARAAGAAQRAAEALREWAIVHPSVADRSDDQLLAEAAVAGRAELVAPPYAPLVPDNTVVAAPVDRSAEHSLRALIGAESAELREELLRIGLPALDSACHFLGAHGDTPQARVQLVLTALAAHATAHPDGLVGAHYSVLSHLEDFLVHEDPDGSLRAGFERRWERTGRAVTALVGRITSGGGRGWERDWAHWSAAAWSLAERRLAAGADLGGRHAEYRQRAEALGDRATAERWNAELRTRYSEFHRLLHRADPDGAMWQRPDYLINRAGTNGLYRLLAICDVRPVERYLAAHLLVRSVPELTGHRWQAVLGAVEEKGAEEPGMEKTGMEGAAA
ncbi:hypothetical protein [Kitasatospora sp. NPDC093102]|uniref:hypothetical protein n=1 Tax=Kitasatospora sp. NPDC093102 TaxID=3155069 RepID=UPI0034241358